MGRPQQPELNRSGRTELDPDHAETVVDAQGTHAPKTGKRSGKVPPANQPGHHPEHEQDKPSPAAVAARLGVVPDRPLTRAAVQVTTFPLRMASRLLGAVRERLEARLEGADAGTPSRKSPTGSTRRKQDA